jgi:hypothetical protein
MMAVINNNDTRDWVAERVVRDGGDSGVVMMSAVGDDGGGGQ